MQNNNIKLIQENLLKIIKKIIIIADKNNINYHLSFGTVLGAVRHNGFIPWDDDIDLCIIGSDYERFLKIMEKEKDLIVVTKEKYKKFPLYFAKIMDPRFSFIEKSDLKKEISPRFLYVDIFKLEYVSDDLKQKPFLLKMWQGINYIKNSRVNWFIKSFTLFIPQFLINKKVIKKTKKITKKLPTNTLLDIHNDASRLIYKYEWFKNTKLHQFEDIKIKIPSQYHPYLVSVYGENYMEIPKEKNRVSHCKEFKVK